MRIVLIDDNTETLNALAVLLRHSGHQVRDFADPRQALADLPRDTDLVVSDVGMPVMDGFGVAEEVHAILGNHLPKVLLISGDNHQNRLERYPPSDVIGILLKPIQMTDLARVISLLARARTQCPGTLGSFCLHVHRIDREQGETARPENPCYMPDYAACPHYNAECGKALRRWVATAGT